MGRLRPEREIRALRRFAVGLTGGIGSGKSTVAAMLSEEGACVVDADRVVHALYDPGARGTLALVALLGEEVRDPTGAVDRPRLAARLFSDPSCRAAVERAIHPLVMEEIEGWLAGLPREATPVVEAALLVESGLFRAFPRVVLVAAPEELQRRRVAARHPDWSAQDVERRIRAQMPLAEKERLLAASGIAHERIDNSGSLEDLRLACRALHARMRAAGAGAPR